MELSYWQSRWNKGNTGFHIDEVYSGLLNNRDALNCTPDSVVLIPMCGKSRDIAWFAEAAKKVIGVEISEKAILDFFGEHQLRPEKDNFGGFTIFRAVNIELWCGDFMKLPEHKLPPVSLIYDKAALIALPGAMRKSYAAKLISLSGRHTQIFLQCFEYDQNEMAGPPFSLKMNEIKELFESDFAIQTLEKNKRRINNYQKFVKRGLKSYLIEYLLLLSDKNSLK